MTFQAKKPPAAPAVYRPQPTPRVLQAKQAHAPQSSAARRAPVAPPAYRPQSTPRCLQLKSAATRFSPPKLTPARPIVTPSRGTVQRFGWALHDSEDMVKSEVVDENLKRAKARYLHAETITDANTKIERISRTALQRDEAIHLHAHGAEDRLANLGTATLANIIKKKFGLDSLAGRAIVLHSCNTGQLTYAEDLLKKLVELGRTDRVELTGATIYAPENYLVVESDGLSYVAKRGVGLGDLRSDDRKRHLQGLGEGWNAWTVNSSGLVVPTRGDGVVAVMRFDENTVKPKPEGKQEGKLKVKKEKVEEPVRIKPRHVQQEPLLRPPWDYGFYDSPYIRKTSQQMELLERSIDEGWYPPRRKQ
ncbi:MAG TPA: hypothetical protein VFZ22_01070 [Pyrinomonadaceae bacterium]|nr:hypothetical protein [Pyrinomonadaceae bacterium]